MNIDFYGSPYIKGKAPLNVQFYSIITGEVLLFQDTVDDTLNKKQDNIDNIIINQYQDEI